MRPKEISHIVSDPCIILVDDYPVRRAGLSRFLNFSAECNNEVFRVQERSMSEEFDPGPDIALVLVNIGSVSASTPKLQQYLQGLVKRMGDVPVAVLSDRQEAGDIIAALEAGARGYLTTLMEPGVMVGALRFIIVGGVFFPPDVLLDLSVHGSGVVRHGTITPRPGGASAWPVPRETLTARQADVLRLLRQGQSNKRIARDLGMCESTVKVHVRQVMRKLGVANRTQAALCELDPALAPSPTGYLAI
ncbi:response regulator transcription factor [Siccirubricoccus sp. KC 17139]|uniref:Response regulator transcription factor n=1 Tax=Siccirubricoccus soli TaxID=2899147 RepID=A0ABT1D7A7_9PROT|nr:response regulator transcription factor [Siccirubricoccus soli]MCO6417822.1 response regulator transcription factor [Siccirubricoccus soli]MCP2683957.1 response regulator transcription factor [Siccirubricoccus soli]